MSIDKFTSRGFGSSGAGRSSWSAPRESYKPSPDQGSNFLFGGAGLRGGPQAGGQHNALPKGGGSGLSSHANRSGEDSFAGGDSTDDQKRFRGIDMSGGDETTTSTQRQAIFVGLFVAALIFSVFLRACGGGSSDTSWVGEHRSHINPDDE